MKLIIHADIPEKDADAFLQHLRDFDMAHSGCTLKIAATTDTSSLADLMRMLEDIDPPFAHRAVVKRGTQ